MLSTVGPQADRATTKSFDEWAETTITELTQLVSALRAEVAVLRRQVRHLERGAGCGLFHPSEVGAAVR